MFTEEPTAQQTPLRSEAGLPSEPAGLPNEYGESTIQPVTSVPLARWHDWFNLLKAFLVWIASIILLVVVQLIFTVPYFIYLWVTTGPPQVEALATDKIVAFLSIVAVLPSHLLTLLVIWLMVTEGRKRPFWKTIDFGWPEFASPTAVMVVSVGLALALLALGGATAFVAVFTAPLVEELIYRGVLYSALERTLGKIIGVIVVSLLFAGVHVFQYMDNIAVIAVITLLSVTLTLARAYTGKVLPSFIIHLVFNGIQSMVIALWPFFGVSGSN